MADDGWNQPPPATNQPPSSGAPNSPYGSPYSAPPNSPYGAPPHGGMPPANNGKAIAALILGIAGCCLFGLFAGIPAIVLGVMARKEIRASQGSQTGDGMAVAGIVLGIISTIVSLLYFTLLLIGFASFPWECVENPDAPGCEGFQDPEEPAFAPGLLQAVPLAFLARAPVLALARS